MSEEVILNPVHNDFKAAQNSPTYSTLYTFYQDSAKAYQNFVAANNSPTYSSLHTTGFQYILGVLTRSASATDGQGMVETVTRVVSRTVNETLGSTETAQLFPLKAFDGQGMIDTSSRKVSRTINEFLGNLDIASKQFPVTDQEGQGMVEGVSRLIQRTVHETLGSLDTATEIKRITANYTVNIRGNVRMALPFTVKIGLKTRLTQNYTTSITGNINHLVAATAATGTDYLGNSNPFNPTVVVDGTAIYGSAPPLVTSAGVYIDIPNTGTNRIGSGALNWGDLYNFGMSLDYSGGTFSIGSIPFFGNRGDSLNIFGLTGTLTDSGYRISNSMKGYTSAGIFGLPRLNKQFKYITNSTTLFSFINNPQTGAFGQPGGVTVKSAALKVAALCQINLIWVAKDLPLTNFSFEPSMNGLSALNSLAQRVGANLRWYGGDTYYVAYPPYTVGNFVIPSAKLISAIGQEASSHLDLETGIGGAVNINSYGTPVQSISNYAPPTYALGGTGSYNLPNNGQSSGFSSPLVPVSGPITKLLTSSDPPLIYSLPSQYTDILVQVLIPGTYTSSGRYVTTDPGVWDTFVAPGNLNQYIYQVYEGGAYIKKLMIDYNVFPTHPAVQAGNFTMQVSCLLRSPEPSQIQNPNFIPTYVQTYKGTINCVFFGVMPLPGMFVSSTVDNLTVSGVIERVSYTSPGFLQLDVTQYTQIDWTVPYLNYNL